MTTNSDTAERDIPRQRHRTILIAAGLLLVIAVLSLGGDALLWDGGEQEGMILVIPEGSAATLDYPTIDSAIEVPTDLVFEQGETLTIRNDDTEANRAGPWVLAAGESLRMRFDTPGEFFYLCAVDASESVTVTVVEPST
ncbi:MAG: hypothetical protein H0V98_02425 [Chloroflexia bacterium]|nr:hypothetical protein [Chloroflexia bacterium]